MSEGTASNAMFPATDWSALAPCGHEDWTAAQPSAMEHLYRAYVGPLESFALQRGWSKSETEDLVQGFYAHAMASHFLRHVAPRETRFRSYLLAAFSHWMMNDRRRSMAQKRGGGVEHVELEEGVCEPEDPEKELAAELHFDRQWAWKLVDLALGKLENAYEASGRGALFRSVSGVLPGRGGVASYAEVGGTLGISEAGIKKAVHQLRKSCGEFIRAEVASTVATPDLVDGELRYLLRLLSEPGES